MKYQYLFGPVASRRLGLSLGIDLISSKTCSLDCIYCECGKTTCLSSERHVFVPTALIEKELNHYFQHEYLDQQPDVFTFSGSGEPTMAQNIGEVIQFIRHKIPHGKIAVLTNSTLLFDPDVRKAILTADIIKPSLDAVSQKSFEIINRPAKEIQLDKIIQGLQNLRKEYSGQMWLEIFIVPDVNTSEAELDAFKQIIVQIQPDKVQLNSLDRPGTLREIPKASKILLEEIKRRWNLPQVEIIQSYQYLNKIQNREDRDLKSRIYETIKRRPSTIADLSEITGKEPFSVSNIIHILGVEKKITIRILEHGTFYSAEE